MSGINTDEYDPKKKRAAKRYLYSRDAQCEAEERSIEVQLLNISTSGIQFACRIQIQTKNPVKIVWKDEKFGAFGLTVLIAREIHKPENREYQYYYGTQYYNLTKEMKESLLALLRNFKDQSKQEEKKQVEKITPKYLFDVIEEGNSFLRRAFEGGEVPSYFDTIISDIKDYERLSFSKDDPMSLVVQRLTTHNFHCNLLGMLTPFMVEKADLQAIYFEKIQMEMRRISDTESEAENVSRRVFEGEGREDDKRVIQKMLNETSNRLFYTKQGLLQSIVETFGNIDPDTIEFKDSFGKIKDEYERILEFTNSSFQEEAQIFKRRSRKPEEYSRAEAIIDVPIMSDARPRYFLWFNIFIIIVFLGGIAAYKAVNIQNKKELTEQIGLEIKINEYQKFGTQFDIVVSGDEWKKLSEKSKQESFKKIIQYLKKDKTARSTILFDEHQKILKILHEEMMRDEGN